MRRLIILAAAFAAAASAAFLAWRRDPRIGSGFVNRVVDPILVERGVSGAGRSEIGTIEHIGRKSGMRRLTPVHPVATKDGFRIIVPLGTKSEWAHNVVAAGHCRLQLHDVVHDLDEPVLVDPELVPGLNPAASWLSSRLGFRYLLLREFDSHAGSLLEPSAEPVAVPVEPAAPAIPTP
jgi:deazaflavin-dependent oxidoreductase (nitroreductase family)